MKCPVCENSLTQLTAGEIVVDVCKGGCGGMWFDNFELQKFSEPRQAEGEMFLQLERDTTIIVNHEARRNCPKCQELIMLRSLYSPVDQVEVDQCPGCAGMWLDAGELQSIQSKFSSEEERHQAAKAHLVRLFDDDLKQMRGESDKKLEQANNIANMLRFICPTYWIPGDQEWGSF